MARIFKPLKSLQSRNRAVSVVLLLSCSVPLSTMAALANNNMPVAVPSWQPQAALPHMVSVARMFVAPFAQPSPTTPHTFFKHLLHNTQPVTPGSVTPSNNGVNLNLTSSQLSFLAGSLGNFGTLTIDVGGSSKVVGLNTKLRLLNWWRPSRSFKTVARALGRQLLSLAMAPLLVAVST